MDIDNGDEEDVDEEVNNKSRPEGIALITDIAKVNACDNGTVGFQFGFPEMHDYKGYHLDQDATFFETIL